MTGTVLGLDASMVILAAVLLFGLTQPLPTDTSAEAATAPLPVLGLDDLASSAVPVAAPGGAVPDADAAGEAPTPALLTASSQTASPQSTTDEKKDVKDEKKSEEKKPVTPPHTGIIALLDGLKEDVQHLPSKPNLFLAALGGGVALGVHPFDETLNVRLRSHYTLVNGAFAPAKYYGNTPEQVALSLGTYAFGRIFDKPKVSHLGMDLLRAQAISELLVQPIKFAVHRERPDGSDNQSFPSGHAAATFAAATVIERHLGWKMSAVGYAIATYVAASRLHDNVHFASDVAFGAALGTIAGRSVTEHGRETWTVIPAAAPGGGVAILVTRAP